MHSKHTLTKKSTADPHRDVKMPSELWVPVTCMRPRIRHNNAICLQVRAFTITGTTFMGSSARSELRHDQ